MRILISGKNGKVVQGFVNYVSNNYNDITVDCLSLRGNEWKSENLSGYDIIYHCVGAVNGATDELYKINRDLTREFALKAKADGAKEFVYLSSMAVYGLSANINNKPVDSETAPTPANDYGKSKLAGEEEVIKLADENFHVHIVRAPSIYGRNTEAYFEGYTRFIKLGFFPDIFNSWKRSVIHIDNLTELILNIGINNTDKSVSYYLPQNKEMLSVSEIVKEFSAAKGKKVIMIKVPKFLEKLLSRINAVGKIFAPIMYTYEASDIFDYKYCVVSTIDSIKNQ